MRVLVTGATGFLGQRIHHRLGAEGFDSVGTTRQAELARRDTSLRRAELSRKEELNGIEGGFDCVIHAAASVGLGAAAYHRDNVLSAQNVLSFCRARGIPRLIFISTKGTRNNLYEPVNNERSELNIGIADPYISSKKQAEDYLLKNHGEVALTILMPTAIVGPGDHKPTPTGQFILDYCRRRLPGFFEGGLNIVHVDDVVLAALQVLRKNRWNKAYILGGANLSMSEYVRLLGEVTGISGPSIIIPGPLAEIYARLSELRSRLSGKEPGVTLGKVRLLRHAFRADSTLASRELEIEFRKAGEAVSDAYLWYKRNHYL